MRTVRDILSELEKLAPSRFAFPFDKVGLQIGDPSAAVTKAVISLDRSLAAAEFAAARGAQLLLCHHPLIWDPLKSVTSETYAGRVAMTLIRNGISFVAAHTNWDSAQGGINDTLAALLNLQEVRAFGDGAPVAKLKLVAFVPPGAVDKLVDAASEAGAGVIGLYKRCAFEGPGTGTFLASEGAHPTVGAVGRVERVDETRIEMVLPTGCREAVAEAVRVTHPYEEPAFEFFQLADVEEQPIGRIGELINPVPLKEFVALVEASLSTKCLVWGEPSRAIKTVAVCGGAADDEWAHAEGSGADVLVSGEVKQHIGLEASESGFALVAAGHYATEHPGCVALRNALAGVVSDVEWLVFEPRPGEAGRPFIV